MTCSAASTSSSLAFMPTHPLPLRPLAQCDSLLVLAVDFALHLCRPLDCCATHCMRLMVCYSKPSTSHMCMRPFHLSLQRRKDPPIALQLFRSRWESCIVCSVCVGKICGRVAVDWGVSALCGSLEQRGRSLEKGESVGSRALVGFAAHFEREHIMRPEV